MNKALLCEGLAAIHSRFYLTWNRFYPCFRQWSIFSTISNSARHWQEIAKWLAESGASMVCNTNTIIKYLILWSTSRKIFWNDWKPKIWCYLSSTRHAKLKFFSRFLKADTSLTWISVYKAINPSSIIIWHHVEEILVESLRHNTVLVFRITCSGSTVKWSMWQQLECRILNYYYPEACLFKFYSYIHVNSILKYSTILQKCFLLCHPFFLQAQEDLDCFSSKHKRTLTPVGRGPLVPVGKGKRSLKSNRD
jgi:hypothetical protein